MTYTMKTPAKKGSLQNRKSLDKKVPFSLKPAKPISMRKVISNAKEKEKGLSLKEELLAGLNDPLTVWMDAQQIMQEFNIKPRALQNWRTKKKIPYTKQGKKILYNRTLFDKMLMRDIVIGD
jgi:hypothetical protein